MEHRKYQPIRGGNMEYSYKKKPVEVKAMQFTDEMKDRVYNWITCNRAADFKYNGEPILKIQTLEGVMTVELGDYVIKGIKGEFYPCKPDIFEQTYDKVGD